jgi:hypothetical protein
MAILDEIKDSFRKGSTLTRLIYINLSVFILVNLAELILFLANRQDLLPGLPCRRTCRS